MKPGFYKGFFLFILLLWPLQSQGAERFEYSLRWAGIHAGTATLSFTEEAGDRLRIVSTARSGKFIDLFYKVRDRAESLLGTQGPLRPIRYRLEVQEGRHRRDKEVVFGPFRAVFTDHLKGKRQEFELPHGVLDPLGGFYRLRQMRLEVGRPVFVKIFDSKKTWDVQVKVLRRERVKVPAGEFDTLVVEPLLQSEGIFFKKGKILIWLTDDERRLPVKLKTKVAVGSITAVLTGGQF
jgi:hypothetical protein